MQIASPQAYRRCRSSIRNRYAIRSSAHATAAKSRANHGKPGRCASTWNTNTVSTRHALSPARATLKMGSRKISTASAARRTACQATCADHRTTVRVPRTRNCRIPSGGPDESFSARGDTGALTIRAMRRQSDGLRLPPRSAGGRDGSPTPASSCGARRVAAHGCRRRALNCARRVPAVTQ